MKTNRQDAIKRIITEQNVETQDELLLLLNKEGFNTTQATISRDIRALNLKKVTYDGNKRKYVLGGKGDNVDDSSYNNILKNSITSIDYSENIIVIKTVSGMAMAVAASIDRLAIEEILGCIAGDDTIFLAIKHSNYAKKIIGEIENVIKYAY